MQFSINIQETHSPFYKACKQHGQGMGLALPYLLAQDQPLFKVVHTESSMFVEDSKGKSYKTHFGNGKKFNVCPSFMIGHGRSINKAMLQQSIYEYDYHLFAHLAGDTVICNVLSSKDVVVTATEDGVLWIEQ